MNRGSLLVCADAREADRIAARHPVAVIGVGKAAAAARLARAIGTHRPSLVLLFGICGAYPVRHATVGPVLDVLDLCMVGTSVFADEGALTDDGFADLAAMRLGSIGPFAAEPARTEAIASMFEIPIVRAATVSTCAGTDVLSAEFARRTRAQIETMESAAAALVCAEFEVPFVELRCVSNRTGARDAGGFALNAAAQRAQDAVLDVLAAGGILA